jgi:hypothetical protein
MDRLAPELRSELGDDAVGAVGVAAVLDFEKRPLVPPLPLAKEGKGGGPGGKIPGIFFLDR